MRKVLTAIVCAAMIFFALANRGTAQVVSGDIIGTILDASGAVVPNATIVAKNTATGVESTTKSTTAGQYRFANLAIGTYSLTVTAGGFTKREIQNVMVQLNQTTNINVTVQVGQNVATVEVAAAAQTVDTTSADVANAFSTKLNMDLPSASSGSGVLNLSLLSAGVATSGAVGVGSGPSVAGQRPRDNNFMVEGIDNNSGSVTGPLVTIPNDAVAEFSVQQNIFSPEFGHSTGGQFNEIVKSGTNEIHGVVYEYLMNRNLNAADNLAAVDQTPLHPRYDNNRFGGGGGLPIIKNKLFLFGLFEYQPIGSAGSAGLLFAPTANGWNTIASYANTPGFNQTSFDQLKKYLGTAPVAAAAKTTPNGAYPLMAPGVNQGAGDKVPASAKAVELGQVGISAPSFQNNDAGVASVDYNPSSKDSMRGRLALNRTGFIDTAASLPVFYTTVPYNYYLVTFSEYHTFTPSLINEFRFGYNRYSNNYPAGDFTWQGLDQFPNVVVNELNAQLGPDPNAPQFGYQNQYQLTDNVSWTKGSHALKFGFDGWRQISPQGFTQRARGDYEWSYLSDYLFDYYPDYIAQRSLGNATYWGNRNFLAGFANDIWKVRPNLTINLGLRYEFNGVPYSETLQSLNAISNVPGLITFQKPVDKSNAWSPRLGVAWTPRKNGNTVIRAGFSRNFDVLFDNLGLLTLPPQMTTTVDVTGESGTGFLAHGGIAPNTPGGPALTVAEARAGTGGYIPDQVRPQTIQWEIGVQHVFAQNYTFETRYVGTHSVHLPVQAQLNRQSVVNGSNALPLFTSAPSQATLDGLSSNLTALNAAYSAHQNTKAPYLAAGFGGIITSYQPWGNSIYHGWANQLTRRFSNGMQFIGSYTYSHNIDDSTAEVFSTYTTPRRPEDINNLRNDRSSSALDHRQRLSAEMIYDSKWYANSKSWFLKNLIGNWEFAPVYTYQTGTLWDVQAGLDANLNGDTAGDRVFVNPGGVPGTGSGITALNNSKGQTVGYLAKNPNAQYIMAAKGMLPNAGRNTQHLNPIDNLDMTIMKRFTFKDKYTMEIAGRFINIFNHPQYIGGYLSDIAPIGFTSTAVHNFLIPQSSIFNDASEAFSSNPRTLQISAKFVF